MPPKRPVAYFGSGTKLKWLSNFAEVEDPRGLKFQKRRFRTSEHAYQSLKVAEEDRDRLAVGGDLEGIAGLEQIHRRLPADKIAKKVRYWTARSDPVLGGIVAKMVTKSVHAKKLERPLKLLPLRDVPLEELEDTWREILTAKLRASPSFRKQLRATGTDRLVEFDRGAKRAALKGSPPFWTALVDTDGTTYGKNWMGRMMHEIRKEIA